jgi:hypothetical protein
MRPIAHFLLPLGVFILYTIVRYHGWPTGDEILIILVGTQLPDVIDKPLAWWFGVIPSGRMVAHSLVVSVPVLTVGVFLSYRSGRRRSVVLFCLAYLSHIVGDFILILSEGTKYYFFPNLFWPLLAANPDREPSFIAHAPSDLFVVVFSTSAFLLVAGYAVGDIIFERRQRS